MCMHLEPCSVLGLLTTATVNIKDLLIPLLCLYLSVGEVNKYANMQFCELDH